jgi:peptidoglycan L-alanyl-D-glutamate endopeptidase CwlK
MDHASEQYLLKVHPDLVKVLRAALQIVPWRIVYGLRTLAAQREAVRTGHSQTMHSRHLPNAAGLSCAVDVAHLGPDGNIDWAAGHEASVYGAIAGEILSASKWGCSASMSSGVEAGTKLPTWSRGTSTIGVTFNCPGDYIHEYL